MNIEPADMSMHWVHLSISSPNHNHLKQRFEKVSNLVFFLFNLSVVSCYGATSSRIVNKVKDSTN